ncbi:hypothetical protein HH212_26195 [Massilia forsythiae]|uniref:Uncharacterized protein n=1 Tax=Massilia forsythiae TaxID=2728020 RepID=A0A7Z2W271_9BURK|nr:hypothetical protein [Massilia forsythiae]QJE03050.1 hypothetical protein HH212_26195 [Massilia forsythiae]
MASAPYAKDGKWYIDKDPEDKRYYVADVTNDLTDSATTAASVQCVVAGVAVLEGPTIQGTKIVVKLGGFDTAPNASNFCTFRVTCANSEQFDRTIYFNRVDN